MYNCGYLLSFSAVTYVDSMRGFLVIKYIPSWVKASHCFLFYISVCIVCLWLFHICNLLFKIWFCLRSCMLGRFGLPLPLLLELWERWLPCGLVQAMHCWLSSYFSTLAFCFFIDRWAILCLIWDGFLAWVMKSIWLYYSTANVFSGLVLWEIKLQGRVESSAAILHDFSQVIDDNFFLS